MSFYDDSLAARRPWRYSNRPGRPALLDLGWITTFDSPLHTVTVRHYHYFVQLCIIRKGHKNFNGRLFGNLYDSTIGAELEAWKNLDGAVKAVYCEALELVQTNNPARLRV
jgi:hypothetical protein